MNRARHLRLIAVATLVALATLASLHVTTFAAYGDITLVSSLPIPGSDWISDVWGYTDEQSGNNYALVGEVYLDQLYIIDVSNPASPVLIDTVLNFPSFDAKTFGHYVYGCNSSGAGMTSRVLDISDILHPVIEPTMFVGAHNLAISENGYLFTEVYGLHIFDLNNTPEAPESLWTNGLNNGHDCTPQGNRLYDFTGYGGTTKVWDITNPSSPTVISTILDATVSYSHSGDATDSGDYLFVCDELASTPQADIAVYDISDLNNPMRVAEIEDPGATVHNLYIEGGLAFVSHYTAGFKVFDVSDPLNPALLDDYDTSAFTGEGYAGAFGVYPWAPYGRVYISDMENGLYIFDVEGWAGLPTGAEAPSTSTASFALEQNNPNPFNPSTSIRYRLRAASSIRLEVFDVRGRVVRALVSRYETEGDHVVTWDGRNDNGRLVASGVYYYRLYTPTENVTKKMVLLK